MPPYPGLVTPPISDAKPTRVPLGRRDKPSVAHTVLRVVGKDSKILTLDVAAFQSFAD